MPLRVAEKDGYIFAVNKCDECPSCFRMLSGVKAHLSDNKPSGFGCFHDEITTRENIGRDTRLDAIPVWCPLPKGEYRELKVLEPENKLDIRSDHHRKKLPNP